MAVIEIDNLTKSFGPRLAVDHVSFTVERATVVGFLGAEGRTVLVSSHLLAEVAQTVGSVVILDRGRLATQSTVDELTGWAGDLEDAFLRLTAGAAEAHR
ncbi:MAG: hypothetical protein M0005_13670 [Actinomycetota bacterium]|nr:hypothetical protein [Actinomycetota bacterium]